MTKPRPEWDALDIATHAMEATSLSQLTLPEVKRMAARVLDDERNAPMPNQADAEPNLREIPEHEFRRGWSDAQNERD